MKRILCIGLLAAAGLPATDPQAEKLAKELSNKGWVIYSGKTDKGDWDLFLMRPDGSHRRNVTNTPKFNEMGVRFSPDGKKILYRRIAKGVKFRHDGWGALGHFAIANPDGSGAETFGEVGDYPWASWSPDGKQLSCLAKGGIEIRDLTTKKIIRTLDRKGIFQQLFWSPDGKWFIGTGNAFGESWTIVRMNVETGEAAPVAKFQNCAPAWFPDSKRVVNSYRPANQEEAEGGKLSSAVGQKPGYGWTQIWMTDADGGNRKLVIGEDGRHLYGGEISPDGRHMMFARAATDGGMDTAILGVMRLSEAPAILGESKALRKLHPDAKAPVVLDLPQGWEPHWTGARVEAK
ncbi:MAG: PD40 domain-containing protein [Bryobacteraceae bacterium]|nr:PD40 domain-containing protein [Bryobacteraceae bacterium]